MQVSLFVTLQEVLEVLRLSYILILQKLLQMLSFVHNFTDTNNTAHVSESACAAFLT